MNYSNKKITSKDELANYLNKTGGNEANHTLEKKALNDPFLADALDGFEEFPGAIHDIPQWNSNKTTGKQVKWKWILSSTLILAILIGGLYWMSIDNTNHKETGVFLAKNTYSLAEYTTTKTPYKNPTIETSNTNTVFNEVTIKKNDLLKEQTMPLVREVFNLETYQAEPEIHQQETNYNIAEVKIKTIAYYNFLAVDYSVIYVDKKTFEEIDLGTPANQSDAISFGLSDSERISNTVQYTYKEYLKSSLKHLSKKNYKNAIANFKTILDHYPQDVNAQFYIGFAYYNLDKHDKAIPYFEDAIHNSFNFFYEDAQWYKALSLTEEGQFIKANELYRKIVKEKGFYAKQAKRKL